jgi:tetratricopeptide (TPR) repeat protein
MVTSFKQDAQIFAEAVTLHRTGRLPEAETLYRQALQNNPNNADALQMLGLLAHQVNRPEAAIELIERSLALAPNNPFAVCNLAEIKRSIGQFPAAIELFKRAMTLDPTLGAAHVNMAMVLHQLGRLPEALPYAQRGVELSPQDFNAQRVFGVILLHSGRAMEASHFLQEAVRLNPRDAVALSSLGICYERLERMDLALTAHRKAVSMTPDHVPALMNYGLTLGRLDQFTDAEAVFRKVLQIAPDLGEALECLAGAQLSLKHHEESVATCKKAIELNPKSTIAYATLGEALMNLGRFDETIELMQKITTIQPSAAVYQSWSNALVRSGHPEEGLVMIEKSLSMEPENPTFHFNRSIILILLGRLAEAWPEYEWRWKQPRVAGRAYKYSSPIWDGAPLNGRRILLFAEQGLGDTVFFGRYATRVAERGGQVMLRVQPELKDLVRSIPGVSQVVGDNEPVPEHDVHLPIMSLPRIFETSLETIPVEMPYIKTDPVRSAYWREQFAQRGDRMKVGLVWEGGAFQPENFLRSASLAAYTPLGAVEGVSFYGLQKGTAEVQAKNPPAGMDFTNLGPRIKDFSDTAAIVENLDLLISIDTSVVHIAGALAKPVWMLMAFTPGHMWMYKREDTPWYPTFRIYRQPAFKDWDSVVERIKRDLTREVARRK